ncbi:hypothetical protein [Mesorhizobium sp. M8A.F.Ca.ET.021.01.1.1]|uniref:hypothetical protein n=1 Tax=Mesorhizobium sp. M8A.F.Ca.ET.021.01.1.1 TaxID=2496757 RepID=UPI000FCBEA19|nr:hypothetical protein [Mesorhizobium sp. M8A.F.Ca.ET.021.01.1.1]RUW56373.1 hypothetical protein EOA36_04500 [Mesorhizobium sp. M8A.F.Ca.ET.021.01.1.1]
MSKFLTPDEIAVVVFSRMNDSDLNAVRTDALTAEDMIRYHHGIGTSIRNEFGLWDPANPYTKHDAAPNAQGVIDDPLFPDQVSHEILKKVWVLVQAETVGA